MADDILNLKFLINDVLQSRQDGSESQAVSPTRPPLGINIGGSYMPRQKIADNVEMTSKDIYGGVDLEQLTGIPLGVSGGYSQSDRQTRLLDTVRQIASQYGLDLQDPKQRNTAYNLALNAAVNIPVGDIGTITNLTGQYGRQRTAMTDQTGGAEYMKGKTRGLGLEALINNLGSMTASFNEQENAGSKPERRGQVTFRIPLN